MSGICKRPDVETSGHLAGFSPTECNCQCRITNDSTALSWCGCGARICLGITKADRSASGTLSVASFRLAHSDVSVILLIVHSVTQCVFAPSSLASPSPLGMFCGPHRSTVPFRSVVKESNFHGRVACEYIHSLGPIGTRMHASTW